MHKSLLFMTRKSPFGYFFSKYGLLKSPIGDFDDLPRKFAQFWHEGSECNVEKVAIVLIINLSSFSLLLLSAFYFSTRRVGARALTFGM